MKTHTQGLIAIEMGSVIMTCAHALCYKSECSVHGKIDQKDLKKEESQEQKTRSKEEETWAEETKT
jgi:hypothetical protein